MNHVYESIPRCHDRISTSMYLDNHCIAKGFSLTLERNICIETSTPWFTVSWLRDRLQLGVSYSNSTCALGTSRPKNKSLGCCCRNPPHPTVRDNPWWRIQMETFSALLALCAGNSPVTGEFPAQRSVARSFGVFFDLRLNKRLSKQSWSW